MRLLDRLREDLILLVHLELEVFAVGVYAFVVKALEDQWDGFLLNFPPLLIDDPQALELTGRVAGTKAKLKASVTEDIERGDVLDDPHPVMQRYHHHRRAQFDPCSLGRELG